jgi:hypothetical protein
VRPAATHDIAPIVRLVVWIERLLRRPQRLGHVLKVHANPRPRPKPPAHRVDEHVGRLEVSGRVGMSGPPSLEPLEGVAFLPGAADLDERPRGRPSP